MELILKVKKTLALYQMVLPEDKILIGVSGGVDSISLLHLFITLKEELNITVGACHVNHSLRGEESDGDELLVKESCSKLGIPFYLEKINLSEYIKKNKVSKQVAARELRHAILSRISTEHGYNKIALAHTKDDQAETILMRILRGSGLTGLRGILPQTGNIIRPLINICKEELLEYLKENRFNFREDSSNLEKHYTRNKIRLDLIPLLMHDYNPNLVNTLSNLGDTACEDDSFLESLSNEKLDAIIVKGNKTGILIDITLLKTFPLSLIRRVLRMAIFRIKGDLRHIEYHHVCELASLVESGNTGNAVSLPEGIIARREYDKLRIFFSGEVKKEGYFFKISVPGETIAVEAGVKVIARILDQYEIRQFSPNKTRRIFDFDKTDSMLFIRTRKTGDFFKPEGMEGKKRLKKIFSDDKISLLERDTTPLLVLNDEILWIVGYRQSSFCKIDEHTVRGLSVEFIDLERS